MKVLDVTKLKEDFSIFERKIFGEKLVYLDSAATSQKPRKVIDSVVDYYYNHNANVHRGIHTLSEEATQMYEGARKSVAQFINAKSPDEVIFTKGTTESLNRVAISWGLRNLKKGDTILLTDFEHHSNLIPWQEEAKMVGANLEFVVADDNGEISPKQIEAKMNSSVKLIAIPHASNLLGTILPIKEICKVAHSHGALVSVDGAQAIPHLKVNVQSLDCDFYSFSGHKMLGPTGIGVLWARKEILENIEPYEFGGGMIDEVGYETSTWASLPERLEAGTPNISGAIGLKSAVEYLENLGMDNIREHEVELNKYTLGKLNEIKGLRVIGPVEPEKRTGLVSFTLEGLHPHDIASILNAEGVAVRSGHHCVMPYHQKLGIPATVRASYYIYNSTEDIDALVDGIKKAIKILN